jgi:hypothetical protein
MVRGAIADCICQRVRRFLSGHLFFLSFFRMRTVLPFVALQNSVCELKGSSVASQSRDRVASPRGLLEELVFFAR